jgi:hypothetical protein
MFKDYWLGFNSSKNVMREVIKVSLFLLWKAMDFKRKSRTEVQITRKLLVFSIIVFNSETFLIAYENLFVVPKILKSGGG